MAPNPIVGSRRVHVDITHYVPMLETTVVKRFSMYRKLFGTINSQHTKKKFQCSGPPAVPNPNLLNFGLAFGFAHFHSYTV